MKTKITLDMLTADSVSIVTQQFVDVDGVDSPVGFPHRRAYINSERGRKEIANDITEKPLETVLAMWGETPTMVELKNIEVEQSGK